MKKNNVISILLFGLFLDSCGLETYVYLEPVEIVSTTLADSAVITLPSSQSMEFKNYIIFYRIYLTDSSELTVVSEPQRFAINTALDRAWRELDAYTANDNVSPNVIDNVFSNHNYYFLYVSNNGIDEISLDTVLNAPSGRIELDFTKSTGPTLRFNTGAFLYLFRDVRSNASMPRDRLFIQTSNLANGAKITVEENVDIQKKDNNPNGTAQNSYVSMYILAFGIDNNYSPIYSRPRHIGIFRLPK